MLRLSEDALCLEDQQTTRKYIPDSQSSFPLAIFPPFLRERLSSSKIFCIQRKSSRNTTSIVKLRIRY